MTTSKTKKSAEAKTGRGGIAQPVTPDAKLAVIVGAEPLTRADLTKKVWDYIKSKDLQDPKDRRSIRADDKLLPIFDGKQVVTMFELTKLVNQHIA